MQESMIQVIHYFTAYSGDGVYLFSTLDEPSEKVASFTFASTATPDEKRYPSSQNRDESKAQTQADLCRKGRTVDEEEGMVSEGEDAEAEEQDDRSESSTVDTFEEAEAAE